MPTDTPTWDDTQPLAAEPTWDNTVPTWDNTQAIAEPTSNKLADAARRIPAGVQSGTGRTLAGAVRAGDIAATPTFIPFMGGLGPGAETINRLNQQMPAVREEFVRGRPQRLAESTAFQLGREIEQAAAPTFGVDPARDNEFLAQLATAAGEMVPTLAAGSVAGPAGVAFQYGTSAGEAQAQEAIAAGKPEAADIAFLSAAGLGGITEAALGVPGRLLAIANRARKAGVNPGTFGRWANRNPMAAGIARAGAEGALREGAQEGLEQAGQNLIASDVAGYAPARPVTEGVGRAMALGATLGGVIGGGAAGLNQAQRNERAALLRTLRDGRQIIVNEQTGTTDFPPLEGDELPPPPPPAPPAGPANVPPPIRGEAAMETRPSASWTPDGPRTPAVDPELADAIAAIRAGYNPEVDAPVSPAPTLTPNPNPALDEVTAAPRARRMTPIEREIQDAEAGLWALGGLQPRFLEAIRAQAEKSQWSDAEYLEQLKRTLEKLTRDRAINVVAQRSPAPALPSPPTLNPTPNPAPVSSSLTQRPEATMETRPAAPLGLQREPTVSPELADAIAAVRGGYNPEVEAPVSPTPTPTPTPTLNPNPVPTPPDQSGGPTELTPPAKAMEQGFRNMAARQVEARRVFVENAVDQFGVTPAQAEAALDHYLKRKWAKLDSVNGRYDLKAGNLWEAEAIRQAAAQAKGQAAKPVQSGGPTELTPPAGSPNPSPVESITLTAKEATERRSLEKAMRAAKAAGDGERFDRLKDRWDAIQAQINARAAQGASPPTELTPPAKAKRKATKTKAAEVQVSPLPPPSIAEALDYAERERNAGRSQLSVARRLAELGMSDRDATGIASQVFEEAKVKPAEVRPAEPGEQPQPPAQAAPAMQEGMDNLRFTSEPVAKAKGTRGNFADAKDAKAKLIAELEKAVEQAQPATKQQAAILDKGPTVPRRGQDSRYMGKFGDRNYAEDVARLRADWEATAQATGLRKVTIEIPGDGTFTVWNTKENLAELLKRAKRLETSTKPPKGYTETGVAKEDREWVEQMQAAQGKPMRLWEVRYQDWNNNNLTTTVEARSEFEAEDKVGNEVKGAQKILPGTKYVGEASPSAVDSAIAALEAAKIKPGGLYSLPDLGLTVTLWNGTLTAAQLALRAGRSLAQAVQAGVDWLRAQGQAFDEGEVRKALEQGLLQAPGIREHVGKRLLQEDFSPAAKAALEPLLRYEVKPDAQLFAEAAAVVEAIGPMEAEANYWGNPWGLPADAHVVLGFAIGNGLSTLEAQARAAGETALADRIGRQNAEFQSQFVLQSTETARTLRAYRYFDLVGNLSPFTADLFARKVIEQASQKQKQRIKPALDKGPDGEPGLTDRLNDINRTGIEEAARTPEVQGAARTAINQAIEEEAERKDTAVERAITLEVSNTLETLPSVVRKANAAVLGAWDKLSAGEQVRQQTGRAGQGLENSLWSAVKQRGGTASTVSSVIAQVNRALHEQMNRALGITPQQFVNPTTYLMRLRDALGNAEVMSRIWEQTRAAVGANLAAIGEMEGLLVRIEAEIAELEAEAKTPLAGGPEVTAKDAKLKAQQQAARDEMLKGRNANLADAIKQRRDRIADVTAQLAEYRKMQPAWQAVMGMTVDVWGPNLLRGLLREQMKADGFRLRKAVADHFRGLAGAPDPLQSLGVLRDKLIAASGLDPQAAERLAKDLEAEYTAQVNKERARLAERLAKARELAKAKAAEREAKRPQLDAESLIDAYERRQTEWLKPTGRKSAVRAIVRQALREGAAVAGLNEQVVRGGLQAQLEAVGVPHEAAYRLAYEVWQERQAKGGGIEAVVAARVKELQLDLGRIIRQHWTQVDKAGESLAEHIVGETKMPAEQAERLATAIQRRFKALVQARKEQALRNLAKTPAARELQKPSVAQRIIEATNLGALDSEGLWQAVADKLGLPTYSDEASAEVKRLADRAQQLPEGSVQRQEATARLMRFIARQKGVNLGDLGWAFWYANTLSGPFTHAVNAFSNVLSLAGNVSTQFRDVRGIPQILAATAKGFRTGLTEARAIVKQGPGANRTKFTEQGQALENLDPQDFTGAGLVSQWRYVARALAAADAAFYFPAREAKAITLARALARQEGKTGAAIRNRAQQILDGTEEQQNLWGAQVDRERAQLVAMGEKPDALWTTRRLEQLREQGWGADIGEAADDFALRTTYNNRPYGFIGELADAAKRFQRVPVLGRATIPFVNVVANVVNDSINYTPWGFARAYAAGRTGEPSVTLSLPFEWAEKLREGKSPMTPDAVVDLHAKAALGTVMVGSLMAMALAGLDDDDGENFQLYGSGPKDAAAKAALRETGWLPYSVRVNGTYLSFANTPLAIPLGALGHHLDAARYDKRFEQADAFNRLGVALWGGAHIITQQSFIDGLARLLGALEERRGRIDTASDRAVEQAFRSISSVAVPNALRQLDRLNDPKIYDARGIEGALVAAIPFARRAGSPALNAFGEPITNEPWKRFASDAEANVWTDLARRKIYPSVADKAKNSNGREMTDDEHYRYVQESGQAIKRRLETPGMRQMIRAGKEEDARRAVTAIVREERERARRRLGF